jgi:hypothetical protein
MALPKHMFIARMNDPPRDLTWEVPDVPDSAGPQHLAELIENYRDCIRRYRREFKTGITSLGGLTTSGLLALVKTAFRASFITDECRPTVARLVVNMEDPQEFEDMSVSQLPDDLRMKVLRGSWKAREEHLNTLRFSPPRLLERPEEIAKLSSILTTYDSAIAVAQKDHELVITGIGLLDAIEKERLLFGMPRPFSADAGLILDILGPGHLRVRDGRIAFTLIGDQLTTYGDLTSVEQLQQWLSEVSQALVKQLEQHDEYSPDSGILSEYRAEVERQGQCPHIDVDLAVHRILREAIRMRHGGAFAVLPNVQAASEAGHLRDIAYPVVPLKLGAELFSTWLAICRVWRAIKDHSEPHNVANAARIAIRRWLSLLRTVGGMSAADGCVILDRQLVVHGFGGSINTNPAGGLDKICRNAITGQDIRASDLLARFGQRHKSAYALCANVPGSLVFVVSQDGNLRIFSSDQEKVYFADEILPWTS